MKSWWQEKIKGQTGAGVRRVPPAISRALSLLSGVPGGVSGRADPSGEMAKAWNAFFRGRYYRVDSQGRILLASRGPYQMAGGGCSS